MQVGRSQDDDLVLADPQLFEQLPVCRSGPKPRGVDGIRNGCHPGEAQISQPVLLEFCHRDDLIGFSECPEESCRFGSGIDATKNLSCGRPSDQLNARESVSSRGVLPVRQEYPPDSSRSSIRLEKKGRPNPDTASRAHEEVQPWPTCDNVRIDTGHRPARVGMIIPGNMGTSEAGNMLVLGSLGLGSSNGLALALARRLRAWFWNVIGLAILYFWTFVFDPGSAGGTGNRGTDSGGSQ